VIGFAGCWTDAEGAEALQFAIAKPVKGETTMIYWAAIFLIIAIVAGIFGFTGIAGTAANIAWILFVIGLILFIIFAILGRRPPAP
jgi:uncharacterized membrane protein YtjA (UPF0391 family)